MSDLRTAAQRALETLENIHGCKLRSGLTINTQHAAEPLRAALAEPVQEPLSVDIVDALEAFRDDRHPMFTEGYDYAVHVVQGVIAKREGGVQP